MRRQLLLATVVVAPSLVVGTLTANAASAGSSPQVSARRTAALAATGRDAPEVAGHAGRWLIDRTGRVLIVHGVNLSSKGYGGTPASPAGIGFGEPDARLLADSGFNAVRITFERYAFEPAPEHFNYAYLAQIGNAVHLLWKYRIHSLIDFHQDDYGPAFNDNGFPAWMTITDGAPNVDSLSFPTQYFANPALWHAFDHFWANSPDATGNRRLQHDDAEILQKAVTGLTATNGLLGFEILNEPFPGSNYAPCLNAVSGCPEFERNSLSHYYDHMVAAIRHVDRSDMLWYEPQVGFDFGVPTNVVPPRDRDLGFAYHDYCLHGTVGMAIADPSGAGPSPFTQDVAALVRASCSDIDQKIQTNALNQSKTTGSALLETEWGDVSDGTTLSNLANLYDANQTSWMFWVYNANIVATSGAETIPSGPRHLNQQALGALVRPYPQVVAGTPISWSFDPQTRWFDLRYTIRRVDGRGRFAAGSRTVMYMPARQYPSGYTVKVSGGKIVSGLGTSTLVIASDAGDGVVTVQVRPRSG